MENSIAVPQKVKHRISIWSHYCTFRYIPKRIKSRDSNIYLHTHVHSSIIHKSWKVETTQVAIDGWMDKQNMDIHALEYYSVMKSKEKSDTCYNMVDHSVQLSHSVVSESLQPCSTPGFPVHHQPLELAQTHVHQVGDATQPSHPLLSPSRTFNLSQIRVFSNESVLRIRWPKY